MVHENYNLFFGIAELFLLLRHTRLTWQAYQPLLESAGDRKETLEQQKPPLEVAVLVHSQECLPSKKSRASRPCFGTGFVCMPAPARHCQASLC